jgi:hypothetical protein
MVFTLIVLAILALIFTFLYMQQKASLVSAASFAAQQGAELWPDSRMFDNLLLSEKTFEGHFEEETDSNGKPKLVLKMDTGDSLPGQKVALIGEALGKRLVNTVLKPENTQIRIKYANNVIRSRLTVEITQEIKIPLGSIKELFDGKDTLTLCGQAEAAITEPAEYIRNIDLAVELSRKLEGNIDFQDLIQKIRSKGQK